ncbi:hypothetical protein GGR95_000577 [Sulfitobacter undariae]|uniref:DUF304 domain-containing protein n=1 Tax=Sulfitobacter undariae TaxID=1563671 RepID=A0A7W6GZU5_9RHOB|nr:hypothetical protein [Sulfitobacter undariae]MBB3992958.1 hypothetical protein [Sulfitobacter undariae]
MTTFADAPATNPDTNPDEVLFTLGVAAPRRYLGMGLLGMLGLMLIYIGSFQSPAFGWGLLLVLLGAGSLWMVDKMRRASGTRIELTRTVLRDSDGTVIVTLADIEKMDSGLFAFKPSNGFLVRSKRPSGKDWRPGLWWRVGRRIGVGGMTPASQTKRMAEIIGEMVAERDRLSHQ